MGVLFDLQSVSEGRLTSTAAVDAAALQQHVVSFHIYSNRNMDIERNRK